MAQPNVAREPSMDEILASIRKIIENNEAQPELAPDAGDDEGFDITAESHSSLLDHPAVVEQFHAEEQRSVIQPLPRVEPAQGGQPAMSLADVAARVRAASERHVAANRETVEREPVAVEPVQAVAREESPLMAANAVAVEPVEKVEVVAEKEVAGRVQVAEVPPAASRDIAALVSPAVSERVAQSFGALAEAMDAGPRRSFDEIAEEMMRPMLQEWLDDNLPTLVERLVREEIERVARGPRR
jgi:cell pole-organizing protein PopZ